MLVDGDGDVWLLKVTYGELLGDLSEGVSANAVRDLELGVVLDGQELGLAALDGSGEAGGSKGEENGDLGEVHFVVGG